jgi:hypothetical protein
MPRLAGAPGGPQIRRNAGGSDGNLVVAVPVQYTLCRRFSHRKLKGLSIPELQADEIRTIVAGRKQIWDFVVIDVWSGLWPSTMVGKRSYRNTLDLFRDLSRRMNLEVTPLITTDGLKVLPESHRASAGWFPYSGSPSGSLATIDDGSTQRFFPSHRVKICNEKQFLCERYSEGGNE